MKPVVSEPGYEVIRGDDDELGLTDQNFAVGCVRPRRTTEEREGFGESTWAYGRAVVSD